MRVTTIVRSLLSAMVAVLFVGLVARAAPARHSVVARVVGLMIVEDQSLVTIAAGSDQGIGKGWHARFRAGATANLLADGDATVIRIDRRTSVLKTKLSPAQVRENRFIQLDP